MNKSQSAGMYIVLAIVVLVFVSSVFMAGPATTTSEISYSNFIQRLEQGEFKKIEKADDFLIAIPKNQPKAEESKKTVTAPSVDNPFGVAEKKAPIVQYKVLTPNDPDLMKKLDASQVEITVKKPAESSQLLGILGSLLLPILFIVFLMVMAKSIQAGGSQAMSFGKSKAKMLLDAKLKLHLKMLRVLTRRKKNLKK